MLKEILERIERRLAAVGKSATAASREAGLSSDAIRNIRRDAENEERRGVSTATLMALAPILKTTASWLLEGTGPEEHRLVPLLGYVGADNEGSVLYATGQGTSEMVELPPGGKDTARAVGVRGVSMKSFAEDGSLIFFEDQRPPDRNMLGHTLVIETADGRILLKRLLKGSHPGVFDLESIVGPTIEDVEVRWVAHITAIIPPLKAREMIRQGDIEAA